MSAHGSPAAMDRPGIVVRVRMGTVVYTSRKMMLPEALRARDRLRAQVVEKARFPGQQVEFEAAGPEFVAPVDLRADRITAIEVRNVHADHTLPALRGGQGSREVPEHVPGDPLVGVEPS